MRLVLPAAFACCDTSSPDGQGYCTIEGCDWNTCPSEAVCIRFFTPVLDEACTIPPLLDAFQTASDRGDLLRRLAAVMGRD